MTVDTNYMFENIINDYLGIDMSDFMRYYMYGESVDPRPREDTHTLSEQPISKLGYRDIYK
jgi:hypothetical protein